MSHCRSCAERENMIRSLYAAIAKLEGQTNRCRQSRLTEPCRIVDGVGHRHRWVSRDGEKWRCSECNATMRARHLCEEGGRHE